MEGLKVSKANLVVYVHPSKSRHVSQAVLGELSSMLFTFSEAFDGVVLAYDINSIDKCAKILSSVHPYFGVKLKVNLLLFSPKPDRILEGKFVKITAKSIHIVVLGFSSPVITEKDIREEFVHRMKHGHDVYASKSHRRHAIKVGNMLRFVVKRWLDYAESKLPQQEVNEFKEITRTMGSTYWMFDGDSCQIKIMGLTPEPPDGSQSSIDCDCSSGNDTFCHVVRIVFKGYNLPGMLSPQLVKLPYLKEVDFALNYLNGTIRKE